MQKTRRSILHLKSLFEQFFQAERQETVAVNEWTKSHQDLHDPRFSFLEGRVASLEGGVDAVAVKSLRSARFKIIYNLLEKGDNVVTFNSWGLAVKDRALYKRIGIDVRISEDGTVDTFRSLVDTNTRLIYLETINSRYINVPDFIKLISYAEYLKIPVVVDNTASVGGYLLAPFKHRANLVIESLEDYLPRSTKQKAVIVDGGNFDWFGGKFAKLSSERVKFLGEENGGEIKSRKALPAFNLVDFLRKRSTNGHNGYPIPHDPFSLVRKLEEIPAKIQLRSDNASKLAFLLRNNSFVSSVNYTGLPNGKGYFQALNFFQHGFGHYLSFSLRVEPEAADYFFEELQKYPAFKHRLTFEPGERVGYISAPAVEFYDLKEPLDESFRKLKEFVVSHNVLVQSWLTLAEID